jgi:DNA-binding response OmpR family regulator
MMPKMNGFELYTKIKKIDDKVRVCFMTALTELHDINHLKEQSSLAKARDISFKSQLRR